MKKILITGGAGMIGSNLVKKLIENENNYIVVVDNFFSSSPKNVEVYRNHLRYEFIERDVQNDIKDIEADEIYHLAAPASPIYYQKDPVYTIRTIVMGTINALECARCNGAKILVASTSEVYGQPLEHPQREDYYGNVHTVGIRACYDEGKRCGETLCADYAREYGVNTKIARIFNTYGPFMGSDDGRVISEFITRLLQNQPVIVNGNGLQTRSFCFVDDLVDGLISLMSSNHAGPINLGNPSEISILELLTTIEQYIGKRAVIQNHALPEDDPLKRRPDISMAMNLLNWKPTVSLDEGIKKTVEYFKKQLQTYI